MTQDDHSCWTRTWGSAAAALALTGLVACGGGGGSVRVAPPPVPFPAAGNWGESDATGSYVTVLPADGTFRGLDSNRLMTSGRLALDGTSLSGSCSLFLPGPPLVLSSADLLTLAGTGSSTTLDLTLANSLGDPVGALQCTPDTPAQGSFPLAALAGTFKAEASAASNGKGGSLDLGSGGQLAGTDPDGVLAGSVAPVPGTGDQFTVTFSYAPAAGGAELTFTGLGFLRTPVGHLPQFVLMTDNGQVQYSGIFTLIPDA